MQKNMRIEIGIVLYPDAQMVTVLGLTAMFALVEKIAVRHGNDDGPALRLTHWQWNHAKQSLARVYDSLPSETGTPTVLILPPGVYHRWFNAGQRAIADG